jgi:hypothetical protein
MAGIFFGIVIAALEYVLSDALGMPSGVGVAAAIVGGVFTASLVWLGGVPRGRSAIGTFR